MSQKRHSLDCYAILINGEKAFTVLAISEVGAVIMAAVDKRFKKILHERPGESLMMTAKRIQRREKLVTARKEKGYTIEQMASELGYSSKSGYHNIESGLTSPPLPVAFKIAKLLGKTVHELFDDD